MTSPTKIAACLAAAVAGLAVSPVQAATIHVDAAGCPSPGSGTVGDPYCSIQTAIDSAVDTDEIIVAQGTYLSPVSVTRFTTLTRRV